MAEAAKTTKEKGKYGGITKKCTCKNTPACDYQDQQYGKGNRIFNLTKQGKEARCTCCTRTIDAKSGDQTSRGHTFQENLLLDYCKIKESDLALYTKRR